jgi:hypothetical protein
MKTLWSVAGLSAVVAVIGLCKPVRSEDVRYDVDLAEAVARTTTSVDGNLQVSEPHPEQQVELTRALAALPQHGGAAAKKSRAARCYFNCPPPVGSVTASPQVVSVVTGALGSVTLHWRWDQAVTRETSRHGCLWISSGDESEAHLVQCEPPGRTYATTVRWIGAGNYVFRVAPGNPEGPFTRPVAGLYQLAQTIVVGAPPADHENRRSPIPL